MNAREYIVARQISWAENRGLRLIGSLGVKGRKAYTECLADNLFEPLMPEVRNSLLAGDGNELGADPHRPAKMQAVHSSAAIGINLFQYWQKIDQAPVMAAACGFCNKGNCTSERIVFEDKYPIDCSLPAAPNIDMVFHNASSFRYQRFAVECRFAEAYGGRQHGGLKPVYLELADLWQDIPRLKELAQAISPDDKTFSHLHAAQLIKHILGLKKAFGRTGFRLLYLWYDALGKEGHDHRREICRFAKTTIADGIKFHALSYQDLIGKLVQEHRSGHPVYIGYISGRYW
ncbi:MAG: hypothetical protein JXO49_04185 [Deltaproteobacteria bacterium]|nr:hypothetical protein [Candidatus Anaeroferrophillus wilburensis]MBN2888528.1 hypothetical protein [Deltaproteobacteria bacterium]